MKYPMDDFKQISTDFAPFYIREIEIKLKKKVVELLGREPTDKEVKDNLICGIFPDGNKEYKWGNVTILKVSPIEFIKSPYMENDKTPTPTQQTDKAGMLCTRCGGHFTPHDFPDHKCRPLPSAPQDSGQAANNFPQSPSRHSVRNSIAPDGSSPSSTGGREGCARGFDSLPVDSIQPTEPEPAPAQTAREWVQDRLFRIADSLTSGFRKVLCGNYALELADRADRAEAEAKRLNALVAEKESVITAWMDKLSGQMSARMSAEAERDRLREALEKIIVAFKGEPCVAPNHPNDGYKCKFSAHPIGRKWGGYCDKHNVDLIARAALNQTTNDQ